MIDGKFQVNSGVTAQPRILFKPGSWLSKIDFINHLVLFNNVLIAVLSEKEGGKTSFVALLQTHLDQQIKALSMVANPPCDREQIIRDICSQLHLHHDSLTDFEWIAKQINERKAHVLLIVDDAHHLPESMIKELLSVIKGQDDLSYFHLCIVSDYSVIATLNDLALDQFNHLIHTIEIGPLNESETRTYVLQRAMTCRLINKPLTDGQFKKFYQLSKGNLAKINHTLEPYIAQISAQQSTRRKMVFKRVSVAASVAMIAGLSYFYMNSVPFVPSDATNELLSSLPTPPRMTLYETARSDNAQQLVSQIPSWQDASFRQLVYKPLPEQQRLSDVSEKEAEISPIALVDKVLSLPQLPIENRSTHNTADRESGSDTREAQFKPEVIKPMKKAKIERAEEKKKFVKQVAVQASGKYTIQLVASHKKSDIDRFRQNKKLLTTTSVRQFRNQQGTWYILTYGEFANRNQAKREISQLPVEIAQLKPWIRSVFGLERVG